MAVCPLIWTDAPGGIFTVDSAAVADIDSKQPIAKTAIAVVPRIFMASSPV